MAALIGSTLFYILTVVCILKGRNKLRAGYIALAIAIGCSILELPMSIIWYKSTMGAKPELVFRYIAIAAAYLTCRFRPIGLKVLTAAVNFTLLAWMIFAGYNLWFNHLSYGTWTGKVEQTIENQFVFDTPTGEQLSIDHFKGNYLLIDCWNSFCGYCFKAFPDVQAVYDRHKESPDIKVIGLHCRYDKHNETLTTGTQLIANSGYTFPCLSIDIKDPALEELGVDGFPTVLIFDPTGKLIFRGGIDGAGEYLSKIDGSQR